MARSSQQQPQQEQDDQQLELQPIRKERINLDPEMIFKSVVIEQVRQYSIDEHFAKVINNSFNEKEYFMNEGYDDAVNDKYT